MNFDKFKGIQAEREIKKREETSIEYLLDTCDKILKRFRKVDFGEYLKDPARLKKSFYWDLHWDLAVCNKKFMKTEFNERDIENFVFAKSNHEYEPPQSEILGMFASALLDILTERNERKGKKTALYINGHGNRFDHLFSYTKHVDTLIVENFKGDMICYHIGCDGKAGIVACKDIEGDFTLADAAGKNGDIDLVIAKNLKGDQCLSGAANEYGKAGIIMAENLSGSDKKTSYLTFAGCDGSIYLLSLKDIQAESMLFSAGNGKGNGIQKALCRNIGRKRVREKLDKFQRINEIYFHESPKTRAQYEQNTAEHRIGEISALVDSINSSNYEQVADKLREIYDSLRPKIEPHLKDKDDV